MATRANNSPLLGYNTNVRHGGHLFHIQTEDSGRDHPHIITHLFTEGTILASKKTSYKEHLNDAHWEDIVRQLMKDQHKSMFVELRDGAHDEVAEKVLGKTLERTYRTPKDNAATTPAAPEDAKASAPTDDDASASEAPADASPRESAIAVAPASLDDSAVSSIHHIVDAPPTRAKSIFDMPDENGQYGDAMLSDKSLDDVILSYISEELKD
ncbi:MAG: hypothetical protein GX146_05435 [Myxococcales bacterium]|jgi:hypothetical protein|nr:hypothetical protein [Myxococcales bacterium]